MLMHERCTMTLSEIRQHNTDNTAGQGKVARESDIALQRQSVVAVEALRVDKPADSMERRSGVTITSLLGLDWVRHFGRQMRRSFCTA